MGRGAVLERVQHVSEAPVGLLLAVSQALEDAGLDVPAVDTNASARQFIPVADEVVGVAEHGARIALEVVEVFQLGHREGMVREAPPLLLVIPFEHREIDDPGESQQVRRSQLEPVAKLQPQNA